MVGRRGKGKEVFEALRRLAEPFLASEMKEAPVRDWRVDSRTWQNFLPRASESVRGSVLQRQGAGSTRSLDELERRFFLGTSQWEPARLTLDFSLGRPWAEDLGGHAKTPNLQKMWGDEAVLCQGVMCVVICYTAVGNYCKHEVFSLWLFHLHWSSSML